jgi:predicted DsbA family dithiol-disulfide isomerase
VLERRYGPELAERRRAMFDQAGLPHAQALDKVPNSRRALMLAELARERGVFDALHPRLFDAYWARGRDIGDEHVLVEEGTAAGLGEADVVDALQESRYLDGVEAQTRAAIELGVQGVPAWVIDQRVLVPGAQPHEVFARVLERLGHEPVDGN